jgi:hypothetical protein
MDGSVSTKWIQGRFYPSFGKAYLGNFLSTLVASSFQKGFASPTKIDAQSRRVVQRGNSRGNMRGKTFQ